VNKGRFMMTRIAVLLLALSLPACGKKSNDSAGAGADPKTVEPAAPKAAGITVNEADWVVKNLHDTAPLINVTMKVPKDAKLEKNGNGGVDITLNENYMITVGAIAVSSIDEAKKDDKSMTTESTSKQGGKILSEDPNGFVYTEQMKTEENGHTYEPEAHFAFYLNKDGAIYSILDARTMSGFNAPGSIYTEALAKQVYGIVKGSAKVN
jgi:hypothetical protein